MMFQSKSLLIAMTVIAVVFSYGIADASEKRHHTPKPKPAIAKSKSSASGGNAKSNASNGGNSLLTGNESTEAYGFSYTEGNLSDLMPMIDGCTATDMVTIKWPLGGYGESVAVWTPDCRYTVLPSIIGEALMTPEPGSAPCALTAVPGGTDYICYTQAQMIGAAFTRAAACKDFPDEMGQLVNCD